MLIHVNGKKGSGEAAQLCDCWPSEKECVEAYRHKNEVQKAEYKESIKDVKDLVMFLLEHGFEGEDADWRAEIVARECAKELLGIEIDD